MTSNLVKQIPYEDNWVSMLPFLIKFVFTFNPFTVQLLTISLHFSVVIFFNNFFLLDPDPGGKMNADQDSQPWSLAKLL